MIFSTTWAFAQEADSTSDEAKSVRESQDIPARTVRFELGKVEGSSGYDVELISVDRRWSKTHNFKIKGELLRVRLSPGRYRVRTRTYNIENVYGPWSEWNTFMVAYKPPDKTYPADKAVIRPISKEDEKIVFEWPELPGTYAYLFEVKNANGKLIARKVLKNYFNTVTLPIANSYSWSIAPLSYEGEENSPNLQRVFKSFQILEPIPNTTPIAIQVQYSLDAYKYEYEFVRFLSYNETTEPTIYESAIPEFRASLEPGEYELRVRTVYRGGQKSDWGPAQRFYVPFTSAAPLEPDNGELLSADHPRESEVEVEWDDVPGAKRYILYIYNDQGFVIQKIETEETEAIAKVPADGTYHYHVQAYSYREKERNPPQVGDRTTMFKVGPYTFHNFNRAEEPTDYYGWAHWIVSQIAFEAKNFDNNSLTRNNLLGGTGQVALGMWERYTKLGLLGFADVSGFNIDSRNFIYYTYGAQLGYRWSLSETERMRTWAGVATKQLPELITRPGTNYLDVQNIQTKGFFIQGSYLRQISDLYAWYGMANFYQSMGDSATPNDLQLRGMRSLQFGAYLSRVFGKSYRGRVGYTFKQEQASYVSTEAGRNNTISSKAHYIGFMLEFALREPDDFEFNRGIMDKK